MLLSVCHTLIAAVVLGGLNALRGRGNQWLRYVIAAVAGALALVHGGGYATAAVQAAGVLVFMLQPWGRWYTLERGQRIWAGEPSGYEKFIERIGGSDDFLCWMASASIFALPLAVLVSPSWICVAVALPAAYAASWAALDDNQIVGGEAAAGVPLAVLALLAHVVWPSPVPRLLGVL